MLLGLQHKAEAGQIVNRNVLILWVYREPPKMPVEETFDEQTGFLQPILSIDMESSGETKPFSKMPKMKQAEKEVRER